VIEHTVAISGIGLCSSLGGYLDACAAFRAGLNRFNAHEEMMTMEAGDEEPTSLTVAPAATNLWQYQGVGRSVKMLHQAYQDFLCHYQQTIPTEHLQVLLAMPDPEDRSLDMDPYPGISREARLQEYVDAVTKPLLPKLDEAFTRLPLQCVFGDRVAFARILKKAIEAILDGQTHHCLLMVADSLLNDVTLDAQMNENLLKHGGNPVGYIPGEGAAVILLSALGASGNQDAKVFPLPAKIGVTLDESVINLGDDEADTEQWLGEKLMAVIRSTVRESISNKIFPQTVSDINGEERRAIEMGNIQVKMKMTYPDARFLEAQVPALGFGELGAMTAPIALATAVAGIQRGYAQHREHLITLSEDNGKRAVIRLQF